MPGELMPIGKHKGESVLSVLEADPSYCEWLAQQPWFREKYGTTYNVIVNYGEPPQDSPEHNQMQAQFLDDEFTLRLSRVLAAGDGSPLQDAEAIVNRRFEVQGWDVAFFTQDPTHWKPSRSIAVECKPDLGDDYPNVLRQISRYPAFDMWGSYHISTRHKCVLVRRARFEGVTWDQVSDIFAASGVRLVREAELVG